MTTEQRLERLEREIRWMRRIGAVSVALAAAVFLIGQGKDKELPDLVVRSLTVKDKDGIVRAQVKTGGPTDPVGLYLMAKDGKVRAGYGTTADGSTLLSCLDKKAGGKTRVMLGNWLDGSPYLHLFDKNGKPRVLLDFFGADGSPSLQFIDANGNVIWQAPPKD